MWQEKNDRKLFVHLPPIYPAPLHFTLYIIFHITAVFKYFSDEITILFKHPISCWWPSFSTSISTVYLLLVTFSISLAVLHHICYWWPSAFLWQFYIIFAIGGLHTSLPAVSFLSNTISFLQCSF